ncbi:hypothetical protein CJ739_4015 [Mariniflexile rhizosphaerae]|uniref:hypothetical protein n=1 Tax=unclassified Mariniflexile TaxID=2643887 RepID=UPI000CBBBFB5|nr:hypothetical protein [Mariniflexile sp. TRM1-10]AXP83073.1 hypothetical protein CJ739_4015 [Mariniflexile sp. TRM1-10]PLB19748.1 MAG: hypothetical protein TRG1_1528 [Flavobacteriaceae bacterium FS1-H7996/R]
MSWDIILFSSKQKIDSIEDVDDNQFEPMDFCEILENSFSEILINENHREIKGKDFSIDFFTDEEPVSNKMISLYGENGLFELIELSKKYGWQIFDTGLDEMIDLYNPEKNGYENHKKYVGQILRSR